MITGYIQPDLVEKAKEVDLLTYLRVCEPHELVRVSRKEYSTKTHDSLKISNGKWMWWSRGIGGFSAVDYLVEVKGLTFYDAVKSVLECSPVLIPRIRSPDKRETKKPFILPERALSNEIAIQYLISRGILEDVINYCIKNDLIYESAYYHDVVFAGFDKNGKTRYAGLRGTIVSGFKGDAFGSNKAFSFRLVDKESELLHVFEGAVDLLSYATLMQLSSQEWRKENMLSLAGVCVNKQTENRKELPLALKNFLNNNRQIKTVVLHLDNDKAGKLAAENLKRLLKNQYTVFNEPAPKGKDVNDYLCVKLQLPITKNDKSRGGEAR